MDGAALLSTCIRIVSAVGGAAKNGDTNRSVGYQWSPEGVEGLMIRSKVLLDARAAGIRFLIYSG